MRGNWRLWGITAAVGVALMVLLGGFASASGSGYNLSFTQTPTNSVPAVGLTELSSSYSSGLYMNASFSVAGTIDLTNSNYIYWVYFGGITSENETASVWFTNNTTVGTWYASSSTGGGSGYLPFTLSNSGSTLSFEINISAVGQSGSFNLDAYAAYGTSSSTSYTWLGSGFGETGTGGGGGGGGACSGTNCNVAAPANALFGGIFLIAVIGLVVVIVVVVVVVLLVVRRRKPPTATPPLAPQPGWAPPPPTGGQMPPPPPPQ